MISLIDHHAVKSMVDAIDSDGSIRSWNFVSQAMTREQASRLVDLTDFSRVIDTNIVSYPQVRVFVSGEELEPSFFCIDGRIDSALLSKSITSSATIVLDRFDSFDKKIQRICQGMQWALNRVVQANVYLTTGRSQGFPAHWDSHDLIVLQLSGSKKWELFEPTVRFPIRSGAATDGCSKKPFWTGELHSGDLLVVPRGVRHRTWTTTKEPSFHMTFGIESQTGVEYLQWIIKMVAEHEELRKDLVISDDTNLERCRSLVTDCISRYPPSMFVEEKRRREPANRYFYFNRSLEDEEYFYCAAPFRPTVVLQEKQMHVLSCGYEISLPVASQSLVSGLLSSRPFQLGALSKKYGEEARETVSEFLAIGLLSPLRDSERGYFG